MRRSVSFDPRQIVWLEDRAAAMELPVADVVRQAVDQAMAAAAPAPAEEEPEKRPWRLKDRVLHALEDHYHLSQACREADIPLADAEAWMEEDEDFAEAVELAQDAYLDQVEEHLVKLGTGAVKKGNVTAIIAFLNAHSPDWGRIKVELLSRIFEPIFTAYQRVVNEMVPAGTAQEIVARFQEIKELKFSAFSD